MNLKKKKDIRKRLGERLRKQREDVLRIKSIRKLSNASGIDHSKLAKVEKGLIDLRIDTLMDIAIAYKLYPRDLFSFDIEFWEEEMEE